MTMLNNWAEWERRIMQTTASQTSERYKEITYALVRGFIHKDIQLPNTPGITKGTHISIHGKFLLKLHELRWSTDGTYDFNFFTIRRKRRELPNKNGRKSGNTDTKSDTTGKQ